MQAYLRYAPALQRKAERILQNREDAQDIVQTLFMDLLEEGAEALELAYLYRAVTNRCLNMLRDKATRARLLQRHDVALRGPIRTNCEERTIDLDLLSKLAGELDREHAEVLVFHYFDDMSQAEIADLIGVSRKTVGVRLGHIRAQVAKLLGQPRGES